MTATATAPDYEAIENYEAIERAGIDLLDQLVTSVFALGGDPNHSLHGKQGAVRLRSIRDLIRAQEDAYRKVLLDLDGNGELTFEIMAKLAALAALADDYAADEYADSEKRFWTYYLCEDLRVAVNEAGCDIPGYGEMS